MQHLELVRPLLDERHEPLAAEVSRVAARLAELPAEVDDAAARVQSRRMAEIMGEARLPRVAMPAECGGDPANVERPDLRGCCLAREALAAASPLADSVFALQCLGAMPIVLGISESLRQRVLPEVIAGRAMAAFAMTEPGAGSDVASLSTRATRDGDGWVIDGHKHLITNAGVADFYCVLAVTDPDAGTRGMTMFHVPAATPGLRFAAPQVLSEPHPLGELTFDGCRLDDEHQLSDIGRGFHLAMATLDRLRPTVAAAACGMAARALDEALDHAVRRRQFGAPLADQQQVQAKLARMSNDLAAARLLTYRAAYEADAGALRITLEAATAKSFATEAAQRVVDSAVQIIGGRACLRDHPVDRLYRAVRALRIYEGATEIQYVVIARELLRGRRH